MTDNNDKNKKDKNLTEPVLGDTEQSEEKQTPKINAVSPGGPESMDLNLNKGERKEKVKADERVKRLDEVMDNAGLISDFDEYDAMETLIKTDKRKHEDDVMRKNIQNKKK